MELKIYLNEAFIYSASKEVLTDLKLNLTAVVLNGTSKQSNGVNGNAKSPRGILDYRSTFIPRL